jgi:hypothetical protein
MRFHSNRLPVFFREEDLLEAYRFALSLEKTAAETFASDEVDHESATDRWSQGEIERAYLESPRAMKLIFNGMVDHPDEILTADDLARFLTHKPHADAVTVRGTMGAFANRCTSRYGRSKRDFPFEHWYVEGGYARYRMSSEVANVLRSLRDT